MMLKKLWEYMKINKGRILRSKNHKKEIENVEKELCDELDKKERKKYHEEN